MSTPKPGQPLARVHIARVRIARVRIALVRIALSAILSGILSVAGCRRENPPPQAPPRGIFDGAWVSATTTQLVVRHTHGHTPQLQLPAAPATPITILSDTGRVLAFTWTDAAGHPAQAALRVADYPADVALWETPQTPASNGPPHLLYRRTAP